MSQHNKRSVLSIYGLSGSGKTRFASSYVRGFPRAVIIDGGFIGEEDFPGERMKDYWQFHDTIKRKKDGLFRLRFCPSASEFPLLCDWIRVVGDVCFVLDEADRYLVQGKIPDEFMDLVARGRHYGKHQGISLVIIGQNPMQIPIDVRRQSTAMVIFNTAEPADVDWLRKMIGDDEGMKCRSLKPHQFIEWVKGEGCKHHELTTDGKHKELCEQ